MYTLTCSYQTFPKYSRDPIMKSHVIDVKYHDSTEWHPCVAVSLAVVVVRRSFVTTATAIAMRRGTVCILMRFKLLGTGLEERRSVRRMGRTVGVFVRFVL